MLLYNPRHTASKSLVEDREDLRGEAFKNLQDISRNGEECLVHLSSIEKQVNLSNNQSPKAIGLKWLKHVQILSKSLSGLRWGDVLPESMGIRANWSWYRELMLGC